VSRGEDFTLEICFSLLVLFAIGMFIVDRKFCHVETIEINHGTVVRVDFQPASFRTTEAWVISTDSGHVFYDFKKPWMIGQQVFEHQRENKCDFSKEQHE
jgi:hypothetical protein